jgi:hypothetical protein
MDKEHMNLAEQKALRDMHESIRFLIKKLMKDRSTYRLYRDVLEEVRIDYSELVNNFPWLREDWK